jgi:hypothetical protein
MKKWNYRIKTIFKSDNSLIDNNETGAKSKTQSDIFPIEPDETGVVKETAGRTALSNNKGETIVEVMVAFVILLIYLAAITTTITASLRITTLATTNANVLQEQVINPVVLGDYSEDEEMLGEISFSNEEYGLSTSHEIRFNTESNLPGFVPVLPIVEP